jgi:hypothetical protein
VEVFYVSRNGHQEGPHSLELIEEKINSGYLAPHDHIYVANKKEWLVLIDYSETREFCKKTVGVGTSKSSSDEQAWYILRGSDQVGPFAIGEIVNMLREKKAYEYDYVWSPQLSSWERISECHHFQPENLKGVIDSSHNERDVFFRRRSARVEFGASLVVHNHRQVWNATGFELSAGGASIEVPKQTFRSGEILIIHFRPSKHVPAFNVECEVVTCVSSKKEGSQQSFRVGLRFLKINNNLRKVIDQVVAKGAA